METERLLFTPKNYNNTTSMYRILQELFKYIDYRYELGCVCDDLVEPLIIGIRERILDGLKEYSSIMYGDVIFDPYLLDFFDVFDFYPMHDMYNDSFGSYATHHIFEWTNMHCGWNGELVYDFDNYLKNLRKYQEEYRIHKESEVETTQYLSRDEKLRISSNPIERMSFRSFKINGVHASMGACQMFIERCVDVFKCVSEYSIEEDGFFNDEYTNYNYS